MSVFCTNRVSGDEPRRGSAIAQWWAHWPLELKLPGSILHPATRISLECPRRCMAVYREREKLYRGLLSSKQPGQKLYVCMYVCMYVCISCKMSPVVTICMKYQILLVEVICMKCQILFSGEKLEEIFQYLSYPKRAHLTRMTLQQGETTHFKSSLMNMIFPTLSHAIFMQVREHTIWTKTSFMHAG